MGFYDHYIQSVTKNDERTRSSVDAIMGRMDKLLNDPDEECHATGRLSGLVVGRVQSGKTRNYIGLMLKAADAGWNVIIVLTSAITALAKQTEDRIMRDFGNSDVLPNMANRLNLLDDAFNENAKVLQGPYPFFFYGVAMKEKASLARITKWMEANKQYAPHMRVLVIDDEADNATPNSNAGKDATAEDPKDIVEDVATAMRECEADDYNDLADWLESLLEIEPPDDAENTDTAKTYHALRNCLAGSGTAKSRMQKILHGDNGDVGFRKLLGLDLTAAESASADGSWQDDVTGEPLYLKAQKFFSGKNYEPCRKPSDFIKVLTAAFKVAKDRSSINKAIISLVDKPSKDATAYTYPFARCAYIAYTATPYACILNERPDQTELYADFIATIEKSPKYFGLDEIYGRNLKDAKARMDIIRSIPDDEKSDNDEKDMIIDPLVVTGGKAANNAHKVSVKEDLTCIFDEHKKIVWQSLKDAIAWSFCCAAARRWHRLTIDVPKMKETIADADELVKKLSEIDLRWTTMLFNIHQNTAVHAKTAEILEDYLGFVFANGENLAKFTAECETLWETETARFGVAEFDALFNPEGYDAPGCYGEIAPPPAWEVIAPYLQHFFSPANRHVIVINNTQKKNQIDYTQAEGSTPYSEDHLWFICGGNTISRGLTLAGLVASYFDRIKRTVAVDTMTQMGRWFGYRMGYELLPRVWMTPDAVSAMKDVAVIEDRMHSSIKENFEQGFSPSDQEHYQLVYYCGRRLTGRDKAKRQRDMGIGTGGSTSYLSVIPNEVAKLDERIEKFVALLQKDYALSTEEQKKREAECHYAKYTLWREVPKGEIVDFLKDAAMLSPEGSRMMLSALVGEIENSTNANWNVVIANDQSTTTTDAVTKEISGVAYKLSDSNPTSIVNGVAHYVSPHLYLPYYANIPTAALNEVDYHFLRELLDGYVIPNLKNPLPDSIKAALAPYPSDQEELAANLKERFGKLLADKDKKPYADKFPEGLREVFKGTKGGINTRASSEYMARVFEAAKDFTPILQFYFIKPPADGLPPLTAISFHWPQHEPERFIAYSAGLQAKPQPPTRAKFYEAVEEVLAEYDFPMPTTMLRSTILAKLGVGCTESLFNSRIAQIPKGRNYESVPKREAYMPKGWGGEAGVEARLDAALLAAAVAMIQQDGKPHKMADIFKDTLTADHKLAALFSVGNSSHKARFNKLISPEVMAENNIAKTCGKPVKWKYQG